MQPIYVLLTANYETSQIRVGNTGIQFEDLEMQPDAALGAEEMLVQLTERNLMLGEVRLTFARWPLY